MCICTACVNGLSHMICVRLFYCLLMSVLYSKISGLAVGLAMLGGTASAGAAPYAFHALAPATGSNSEAYAINNDGVVVGASGVFSSFVPIVFDQHATVWRNGAGTLIDGGAYRSTASAVGNAGQVVGSVRATASSNAAAAVWNPSGSMTTLPGNASSGAAAINASGTVAGTIYSDAQQRNIAAVWANGGPATLLDSQGSSGASAINAVGTVVGYDYNVQSGLATYSSAMMWRNGAAVTLAGLGGLGSSATDINDAGTIVGHASDTEGNTQAVMWHDGILEILLSLNGGYAVANGINEAGQTIGTSVDESGTWRAVLWDKGQLYDLNDLLDPQAIADGWELRDATDINDHGWIVGQAYNRITSQFSAYLLQTGPTHEVPEPSVAMLMLVALAAFAGVRIKTNRRS